MRQYYSSKCFPLKIIHVIIFFSILSLQARVNDIAFVEAENTNTNMYSTPKRQIRLSQSHALKTGSPSTQNGGRLTTWQVLYRKSNRYVNIVLTIFLVINFLQINLIHQRESQRDAEIRNARRDVSEIQPGHLPRDFDPAMPVEGHLPRDGKELELVPVQGEEIAALPAAAVGEESLADTALKLRDIPNTPPVENPINSRYDMILYKFNQFIEKLSPLPGSGAPKLLEIFN